MTQNRPAGVAAVIWLALLLSAEVEAVEPGFRVVSVEGTAPQSKPVSGLPSRFLQAGQALGEGDEFLMLPKSSILVVDDQAGRIHRVVGPNRFWIRAGVLGAHDATRLTLLKPRALASPREAVEAAARWLREQAWVELALHYDLAGTDIPLSALCSGSFYLRDERPEVGHPGGFGRYIQPFAPAFGYESHRTLASGDIQVWVQIEIDQGGGMIQRGRDSFTMRRSAEGLRFVPKTPGAEPEAPPDPPAPAGSGPGPLPGR